MKLGLIQMPVTAHRDQNVRTALRYIDEMKRQGAELAVLPEMFLCPYGNESFRSFAEPAGGPAWKAMSAAAKEAGLYLVAGSLPEQGEDGRLYNTSFVFGPDGRELARHRKIHLFDIDVSGGQHFRESDTLSAGTRPTLFDTPFCRVGVCICFDIRFPELSRWMALRGARLIVVPAAFNPTTGPAHWELAFRSRAVDNQVFTVGVAPARDESAAYVSYGHTLATDPWGRVLAQFGAEAQAAVVELDLGKTDTVREQLPLLSARRTDLYDLRWDSSSLR